MIVCFSHLTAMHWFMFDLLDKPKDAYELPLVKDEILDVLDTKENWWVLRKGNGAEGSACVLIEFLPLYLQLAVAPSNYLRRLSSSRVRRVLYQPPQL
jgi:hypothetical protein